MTAPPDLLVIGGGITGQAAALAAADRGAKVEIVDFGRNAGSAANAGSLHVQMQSRFLRLNPHLADNLESSLPLYLSAVTAWEALDVRLGGVELTREGGLMLAETPAQMAFLEQKAERETAKGLDVEILGQNALRRIAPYLGAEIIGGELCRNEGKLNPLLANNRMSDALTAAGVVIHRDRIDEIVDGPVPEAHGARAYRAKRLLVAAAWGAGSMLRTVGLTIPTEPEPLHMNITEAGAYEIHHLVQHAERSITLKQFRSGQVVIGGGWPATRGAGDSVPGVRLRSLAGNVALAGRIAPGITGLRVLRTWAGYNTPVDGKATIGPVHPTSGVFLALPGDAGYTLGPIVGQTAAALALGWEPPLDPEPYAPTRWAAAA
ncbi:FAD-binding oxidoreductase [Cognatishimia sp. F0-27]|uniref:NAD(P)/FAD-dependent oxidoreductase n=1 Tax=Cognatishimia sp. F0-27 TaxID=2816855 RepID=UPI001D0CCB5A|nr:FAD-binding oxidoreductase [Cognatishimia sp. F0-27]MCC1493161.1 FAD-binding oxidoreductase [Cognatishimia sp. F0-27]